MVKFLIIRFSSIGDIVLTTPVIRCLKMQVEEAEIHYLTKKQYAGILENNPNINKVHVFDGNISKLIQELKLEFFDHIIDLHHNLRSARIKNNLPVHAQSFNKLNWEKWLLVNLKINRLPNIHIVDRYLQTTRFFDVENDNQGLDYFIPEKDEICPADLRPDLENGYILFAIGAQHATKRLPVEKIISVCRKINKPIVLSGGKEDLPTAEKIKEAVGNKIYNACGNFNLNQSASLVKNAKTIITHDTGLMHIAAAFRKKIISVWGNTVPEFGMYPYFAGENSKIVEVKNLKCRPCTKIGFSTCPKKHFNCMNQINEDEIVRETEH
jgi:heptosyltransferase-2